MKKQAICVLLAIMVSYSVGVGFGIFEDFREYLGQMPFLTPHSKAISLTLPAAEMAVVILLIFPFTRLAALYAGIGLFSLCSAYFFAVIHFNDVFPSQHEKAVTSIGNHRFYLRLNTLLLLLDMVIILAYPIHREEVQPVVQTTCMSDQ